MKPGDCTRWADAYGTTAHTLRRWERAAEEAERPPPGRPSRSPGEHIRARELVSAVLDEQGWSAGEGPVRRALGARLSLRLVRRALAELKRERRCRHRAALVRQRRSIQVNARDALWSQDATHLGRDQHGRAVLAEVIREVASTRTLEIAVGPAAAATDVIAALERARMARGTLPLVWATDNGPPYVSAELARYLAGHQVIHLQSLPRTPQHNAWAEHGMRELKDEAELEQHHGTVALHASLLLARERLDRNRPRRSRGWRTAVQADLEARAAEDVVPRARFYAAARCAIDAAVLHSRSRLERRRATRAAILLCMERFGLITRNRAGDAETSANSYRVS